MTQAQANTSMAASTLSAPKAKKAHELVTCTIKAPPFSYAHLEVFSNNTTSTTNTDEIDLDALQVRSYCTAALKQFLGATGTAVPLDILKVDGRSCWLRVPRDDLGAFSAAITAWQGTSQDGVRYSLRLRGCSDWLGALVGQQGEERLWTG
ncbi:Uu.00g093820.m01.CDS01 [Anthostomella pinea]|uniref:Uu.00g093820.m01.CDS01 n=1 Tax=Anthostomella pinea TaxID=933095 RepID=A0AAI8VNI4_9PEZI|nr:Uu.00g093820.m01.CDS01 [Anthostomella pinea]